MEQYPGHASGLRGYSYDGTFYGYTASWKRRGSWEQASVSTPGWKSLSRSEKRELAWKPYTYRFERWDAQEGSASGLNNNTEAKFTGFCFAPQGLAYFDAYDYGSYGNWPKLNDKANALSKLQAKVSQMSMNLAQAVAERKQTVGLISDTVRKVVQLALWIKKGDFKSIHARYGLPKPKKTRSGGYVVPDYYREVKVVSTAFDERGNPLSRPRKRAYVQYRDRNRPKAKFSFGDMWLEYSYGWKPLLADIHGAAVTVAKMHQFRRPIRFTSYAQDEALFKKPFALWSVNGTTFASTIEGKTSSETKYLLEVVEDAAPVKGFAEIGLTNPLLLAWEVIPYSFVLDWFVPLGGWLEQLEYARGVTFKRCMVWQSSKSTGVVTNAFHSVAPDYQAGSVSGAGIVIRARNKSRVLLSDFPYQEFPRFQPDLGVSRVASGLALLNQIFTRGKTTVKV